MTGQNHKNILISRTDHLGDVILATPVATALKSRFPSAKITFLSDPACREVPLHHPDVDHTLEFPGRGKPVSFRQFLGLVHALKQGQFDAAVLVYPDWRVALAAFLARIPVRVGTGYRLFSLLFNRRVYFHRSKGEKKHETEYNLELLQGLGAPVEEAETRLAPQFVPTAGELQACRRWLKQQGLQGKRLIAVHPGSFGSALNWDARHYAQAAQALAEKYHAAVVLTGTEKERPLCAEVASLLQTPAHNLAGLTTLPLLAGLYKHCQLFLGSSTGPIHLAAAVGTPVIGIYCPITVCGPWRWSPRGGKVRVILSAPYMDCPVCLGPRCPYYNCMNLITVNQVLWAANQLLNPKAVVAA